MVVWSADIGAFLKIPAQPDSSAMLTIATINNL